MQILLLICSICLLLYLCFVLWSSWNFSRGPIAEKPPQHLEPLLSVLIPARNEEAQIESCLKSILEQVCSARIEVLLIDDHSTDRTRLLAEAMRHEYPQLRIQNSEGNGKKAALASGIKAAKGSIIFQIDADCRVGKKWMESMWAYFEAGADFVSGPVALESETPFQTMQALESMGLVVFGAGFLIGGRPNMANGANMAYRKEVFEEIQGYEGIDHVASGDDELLLQKIRLAGKYKISFCKKPEAIVRTTAPKNWKDFKAQRIRWVSKSRAYLHKGPNLIQGIAYLGFLTFPLLLVASFQDIRYLYLASLYFLIKLCIDLIIMLQAARFFHNLHMLRWFLPLTFLYIPYVIWIGMAGILAKSYSWKGRNVS
ncbi:MAG: glycosyltransferase [Bacteroidia bacterium]|nr:glycosyltransferase [Bacteroidia bacterium]